MEPRRNIGDINSSSSEDEGENTSVEISMKYAELLTVNGASLEGTEEQC